MKKTIFLLFFFYHLSTLAQGEANIWYFGLNAGLDFNSGSPINLNDGQLQTIEGCATMSNSMGELLFYTDGISVWNKNHEVMSNGQNLLGSSSSTQSSIIVPKPNSNSIYYIFTTADSGGNNGLRYNEVDMSLNNGLGDVTNLKNELLITPVCEKISVVKNGTNNGYWVLTHKFGSNHFVAYSVDSNGVNINPVISSIGISIIYNIYKTQGQLKFSPNGAKVVCVNAYTNTQLFDFNNITGTLSNTITINTVNDYYCYGAEFSPCSTKLYITAGKTSTPNRILQYDLLSNNIPFSETNIAELDDVLLGSLQLASDNKIYCAVINFITEIDALSVINSPENLGLNCDFQYNQVTLTGKCRVGLPQSIQSIFDVNINIKGKCLNNITHFSFSGNNPIISASWDFGDGFISSEINPQHVYTTIGTYAVTVNYTSQCENHTKTIEVVISENPIAHSITDYTICDNNDDYYDLSQNDSSIIGNQSPIEFKVTYFTTFLDATNNANLIINPVLTIGDNLFYAKVYSINNNCYDITSFKITKFKNPIINPNLELIKCTPYPYDVTENFNLNEINNLLIQDDTNHYNFIYYTTETDALNNINSISNNYTTISAEEIIYVRVENIQNISCFTIGSFKIKIIKEPNDYLSTDFKLCEDQFPNDGKTQFDLTIKKNEILNHQSTTDFNVMFFPSYLDAINSTNQLNFNYANDTNPQLIFAKTYNSIYESCYKISTINLIVEPKPEVSLLPKYTLCEFDNLTITLAESYSFYNWSNGYTTQFANFSQPAEYSVTVTNEENSILCETTKNFTVELSNKALINSIRTIDFSDDNSIEIIVSGIGEYEYSLDGIIFQDSNTFNNIVAGEYVVYVRDKKGCGITQGNTYVLSYPKFFTPNGDGYNDFWKINFSHNEPNLKIKIFDRYGTFITTLSSNSDGWDGKFNGKEQFSDDYWFIVTRGNGEKYKGHFTLKR
ncbi:MAG: T9SS type B sorting domain-containing protein [Bacteroidetes bacterium]|uniref:T9SS type B sorting domain-containing protein n=1 Tax=Flavobacterium sp. TaxID=239 RepID=UPI002FD9016E|nr:T9SS type B sorting domain-containing protein [Bacteroidota bacterium]